MISAQPLHKRIKNFSEVALGFSKKQAVEEAMRCPQPTDLSTPQGCPLDIDIFSFVRRIREGDVSGALMKIREQNPLPGICGRVCSAPCEKAGILSQENPPIEIKALERYAADNGQKRILKKVDIAQQNKKVAVVGSGPAGLTAAADLAKLGYPVTVFEAMHAPGGYLKYGVPEFRLPKKILDEELARIQSLDVTIKANCFIGQTKTIQELFDTGYSAIYLATGNAPQFSGITGENLKMVYMANEFLMRLDLMQAYHSLKQAATLDIGKEIAVLGSGDAAMDCARICVRLGRKVTVVYDGTEDMMAARPQEIRFAKEEGVKFELFTRALEIIGDDKNFVHGLKCIRTDFADSNASGQWKLTPVQGSEFVVNIDAVVIAGDLKPNSFIAQMTLGLKTDETRNIAIDGNTHMTSLAGVFAGRYLSGAHAMVEAMAQAKKAAQQIDQFLKK